MQLTRHLSFRPADLFTEFDRIFRSTPVPAGLGRTLPRGFGLYESDEAWILRADLPCFRKEDLEVEVRNGQLTLKGSENEERFTTSFEQSLRLPKGVKQDGITARLQDGVLELTLPKEAPQEPEALRIDIK